MRESRDGKRLGTQEIGEEDGEGEAGPGEEIASGDRDCGSRVNHFEWFICFVQSVLERGGFGGDGEIVLGEFWDKNRWTLTKEVL